MHRCQGVWSACRPMSCMRPESMVSFTHMCELNELGAEQVDSPIILEFGHPVAKKSCINNWTGIYISGLLNITSKQSLFLQNRLHLSMRCITSWSSGRVILYVNHCAKLFLARHCAFSVQRSFSLSAGSANEIPRLKNKSPNKHLLKSVIAFEKGDIAPIKCCPWHSQLWKEV